MWKGVAAVSVLFGLGACGGSALKTSDPPGAVPFAEGTRLKARWLQAPGAPRRLVGWYDTQLQASCSFRGAYYQNDLQEGDGDFYCIPQTTSATGELFADAACTQPVADVACDAFRYVELPSLARTCDAKERFFAIGEALPAGSVYAKNGSLPCVALAATDPQMPRSPHKLGPEVPLGTFVSARLDGGGSGGRIGPRTMRASDGSSEVWGGAWDRLRSENVFAFDWPNVAGGYAGATPGKWEPGRIGGQGGGLFGDAGCTQQVVAVNGCGDLGLNSLADTLTSTCSGYDVTYLEAGAAVDASNVFEQDGATCRPYDASGLTGNEQFIAVGAPVPASTFVAVQSFERGSDRIRLRSPGTDAGPIAGREDFFFDTQRNTPCGPVLAADGILRCLPLMSTGQLFGDAACSQPVMARLADTGSCPAEPVPPVVAVDEYIGFESCDDSYRRHVFPVGAVRTGTIYVGTGPADCEPLPADPMLTVYQLGPELPPTDFVELTRSNPF